MVISFAVRDISCRLVTSEIECDRYFYNEEEFLLSDFEVLIGFPIGDIPVVVGDTVSIYK